MSSTPQPAPLASIPWLDERYTDTKPNMPATASPAGVSLAWLSSDLTPSLLGWTLVWLGLAWLVEVVGLSWFALGVTVLWFVFRLPLASPWLALSLVWFVTEVLA